MGSMGFTGASGSSKCSGESCGSVPPGLSELACSGAESSPLTCPREAGDDVFCAPSESMVVAQTWSSSRHLQVDGLHRCKWIFQVQWQGLRKCPSRFERVGMLWCRVFAADMPS